MAVTLRSSPEFRTTAATKTAGADTSNANRFIAEIPEGGLKPEGGSESDELHGGIGLFTARIHQPAGTIPY
jgi:hypothetical protein